jgi:hypothetical protein
METETIEIKPSKLKNFTGLLSCILLTAASIFILLKAEDIGSFSPTISKLIGWFGILFFGLGGGFAIFKTAAKSKIGLTLNSDGILDNASGDFIQWREIKSLGVSNVMFVKFISVYLNHPKEFLDRQPALKKFAGWLNDKIVGTPVNISNSILNIGFEDLYDLITRKWEFHRKQ